MTLAIEVILKGKQDELIKDPMVVWNILQDKKGTAVYNLDYAQLLLFIKKCHPKESESVFLCRGATLVIRSEFGIVNYTEQAPSRIIDFY